MEDEAGEDAEGDCEDPEENVVGNHEHFCVAAAAENAFGHDAVCGAEDDYYTDGGHELLSNAYRFCAHFVSGNNRVADQHNKDCGNCTKRKSEAKEHPALLHSAFLVAKSERLACNNGASL